MSLISFSSRHPGGQPCNTNAPKHSFYACNFKPRRLADYARARLVVGLASLFSKIWPPSDCLVIPFTFTALSKSHLGW